ncbi:snRNA-activating protein complex subunit 4 [Bombina bombina]|uniref:snRNA-activating protein complex subunit 4 n=1 Tax=Bombina bombina TaxID=8345 RepID=UPI00235A6FC6|nr:snRNA-activating protein complex subunit 4 [Bombina bombina]
MNLDAEREKIQKEIEELERSLGSNVATIEVAVSDCSLDTDDDDLEDLQQKAADWDDTASENTSCDKLEICLQMNLVYQAIIEEKIQEVELLIAQNKEQQVRQKTTYGGANILEEMMWELSGRKGHRTGKQKLYPLNLSIGHFIKPYFKDKVTGVGPPANQDTREKAAQGIKAFEELANRKWRSRDNEELKTAVISDYLQRKLQPKLFKVEYLNQKLVDSKDEMAKKILTKQIQETETEIEDINHLPEESLLGERLTDHDWDKISKINFEGVHSAEKLKMIWQNREHPHISKVEWAEEEIDKLQKISLKHNYVNWQAIADELGTNRTAFQCLQKFQQHNKEFKKKEFTKDEDEMLTHLVQQMRVGNHIPYQKISYFMEGRDGMQLLYRWSKSLDPNLKRGFWSPSEDEMLLKAVAKYGEKEWYKIRLEVPGRSDMQCRERYKKGLHADLKKGKWSFEEHKKFLELVEKYGVGRWTKIASELTHRTGSQCLSKWKLIMGLKKPYRKRQRKKKAHKLIPIRKIKKEYSSEDSTISEESEDMEMDFDSEEEKKVPKFKVDDKFIIPSIDEWIPKRQNADDQGYSFLKSPTLPSFITNLSRLKKKKGEFQFNTMLKGIAYPHSTDIRIEDPEKMLQEAKENCRHLLQIEEGDVRKVLKRNTKVRLEKQLQTTRHKQPKALKTIKTLEHLVENLPIKKEQQPKKVSLYKDSVDRKLLLAVTPWVGNVFLPISTTSRRTFRKETQADAIRKTLSSVNFTSTPVFTFFIQFFRLDADGCLQMIQKRRPKQPNLQTFKKLTYIQPSTSANFVMIAPQKTQNIQRPVIINTRDQVNVHTPIQKPKTVAELLREKRMRESKAKKSTGRIPGSSQRIIVLQPQSSVPSSQKPLVMPISSFPLIQLPTSQQMSTKNRLLLSKPPGSGDSGSLNDSGAQNVNLLHQVNTVGATNNETLRTPNNNMLTNNNVTATNSQFLFQSLPANPGSIKLMPTVLSPARTPNVQNSNVIPFSWVVTPGGQVSIPIQAFRFPNQNPQVPLQSTQGSSVSIPISESGTKLEPTVELSPLKTNALDAPNGNCSPLLKQSVSSSSSDNEKYSTSVLSSPNTDKLSISSFALQSTFSSPASSAVLHSNSLTSTPATSSVDAESCIQAVPSQSSSLDIQQYPVVKISQVLPTDHSSLSNNVFKLCQNQTLSSNTDPTTLLPKAEKKALDLSLVSLEEEEKVKEWLQGNQGVEISPLQNKMGYLPPSVCNLKALGRLLLQKRTLEENAFKLVPSMEDEEISLSRKQEILNNLVDEKLKNNTAYLLLKQRFLSAFTFPALLASLPTSKVLVKVKREDSDEDSDDSEDRDMCGFDNIDKEEDFIEAHSEVPAVSRQETLHNEDQQTKTIHQRTAIKRQTRSSKQI